MNNNRKEQIEILKVKRDSLLRKLKEVKDEIDSLMREGYSDSRVYTNGERARDVRLDRTIGLG